MKITAFTILILAAIGLAACKEDRADLKVPDAMVLTEESAGYYCQMAVLDHTGPKGQMHLAGYIAPIWFSQVRDGIAYIKSPEQSAEILVFYVNDMGAAASWDIPGSENWIDANDAFFVVGSDAIGSMGAPEIVPFGARADADVFAATRGGSVMLLADIPADLVLSPIDLHSALLEVDQ